VTCEEEDLASKSTSYEDPDGWQTIAPEHMSIFMPSSLQIADMHRLGLVTMASQKLELSKVKPMMHWKDLRLLWT